MILLAEDEAREKLCPFARNGAGSALCVASGCMAWRFADDDEPKRGYCCLIDQAAQNPARVGSGVYR
jgi:hypothetical protein